MKHFASAGYWRLYQELSEETRALADKTYELLRSNPRHPSLRFKRIGPYWSVRVGLHHRALGRDLGDTVLWFWIGTHSAYDKLVC